MNQDYKFSDITKKLESIYVKKNIDYGNSFENSLNEFGKIAYTVRANDKMERIKTLSKQESKVKDESMTDTVRDLANYCIMYLMWEG